MTEEQRRKAQEITTYVEEAVRRARRTPRKGPRPRGHANSWSRQSTAFDTIYRAYQEVARSAGHEPAKPYRVAIELSRLGYTRKKTWDPDTGNMVAGWVLGG